VSQQPYCTQTGEDNAIDTPLTNTTYAPPTNHTNPPRNDDDVEKISVLYTNARSLIPKRDELRAQIATETPDVVSITETWASDSHIMSEFTIPGYDNFQKNRSNKKGGGVMCYVKTSLAATKVEKHDAEKYDSVYVEIPTKNNKKTIIATIYRPPKQQANDDAALYEEVHTLIRNKHAVVVGDFNCPNVDWETMSGDQEGKRLIDMVEDSFLTQVVRQPTRNDNILDLVLTSDPDTISKCEVGEKLVGCDHNLVRFKVTTKCNLVDNKVRVPNYRMANFDRARELLPATEWERLSRDDIEGAWTNFKNKLIDVEKTTVPMKVKRVGGTRDPPWMSNEIKRAINVKKINYKTMKQNATREATDHYHNSVRTCKRLIRRGKHNYESQIARDVKANSKKFFAYIRSKRKTKSNVGPLSDERGELTQDSEKMASILNINFASVFTREHEITSPTTPLPPRGIEPLEINTIYEEEVKMYLDTIDTNKSTGPDNLSPRLIKELRHQILKPLTGLFNQSVTLRKVPEDWKLANVTPIFKKGEKNVALNYRPISLTSVPGKILERIIRDRLVKFLEDNKLISEAQHGFRNRRSCLTNLLNFFQDIYKNWDDGLPSDILYLDFQKAFDKVPHQRLLHKLRCVGLGPHLTAWIGDWLIGRKQRVQLNGKTSEWLPVTSGVPQGSVLGPVLFIIYINDLETGLKSSISKFADDTKVGGKALTTKDCEKIQRDLDLISQWSEKWQMPFNVDKCKVMHVGPNNCNYDYIMNGRTLSVVDEERDLGVIISKDLKFAKNCKSACKKANQMLGFIARNIDFKTPEVMRQLYNSLVRPHLEYAVQFWSPHYRKDIDLLERVQRRATKMIPALRACPYEERLKRLNLFSLEKRRLRGDLIQVFKYVNNFHSIDFTKLFEINSNPRTRNNGMPLIGKRCLSDIGKNFFTNRIISDWNQLPSEVIKAQTINSFKYRLDRHFTETGVH
jgi:ribonuclease P/MRP protein subunit RPP40